MKTEIPQHEIEVRMFLYHRFGLLSKITHFGDKEISIENLEFHLALDELKRSYKIFLESKEMVEKIFSIFSHRFALKYHRINEKDSAILIHKISASLLNLETEHYYDNINEQLSKNHLVIIPIKTFYGEKHKQNIKAIALFDERLIKINPQVTHKNPSLRIYRIQPYPLAEMQTLIKTFRNSFLEPLDYQLWDVALNTITQAEKINTITKKEQIVGNGSWLTAKMLIMATVYSVIYDYCYSKDMKDFEAEPLCSDLAEALYKLFIVDDRNRAVQEYLELHGFHKLLLPGEILSVTHRLASIKEFFVSEKDLHKERAYDKDMLEAIYTKSLNWLLADYLKKGDIGAAHALIASETNNHRWNPLIYAARNGKIAIAELLGSNAYYMTQKDRLGNLPIHYAIQYGHEDIFRVFIRYKKKNKLNLLAKNHEGQTPLHLAALNNELEMIDTLLDEAPELLNMKNEQGDTALKLACDQYNTNTIEKLLSKGAAMDGIDMQKYAEEIQTQLKKSGRSTLL